MQPLTKQELQQSMQQLKDSIMGTVATRQDVSNAVTSLSQKMCGRNEIQNAIDASREKYLERLGQPIRQQQAMMQQIIGQLDVINRRLVALESRMGVMHGHLQTVRTDTHTVANRTEPTKTTLLSQMFT